MLNRLKPALRQFRKYPAFSLINLGGLSIGIAASFLLFVYAHRELNTDRQFHDADRIYRIATDFYHMGPFAFSQAMMCNAVRASCKDVEDATAITAFNNDDVRTSTQDRAFKNNYPYYIDTSFFKVFSYTADAGRIPPGGLGPNEAILSPDYAQRFFGNQDPIGKTIYVGKKMKPYKVVAVLHQGFEKSHLHPRLLLPRGVDSSEYATNWVSCSEFNYVKLRPGATQANLQTWLDRLREKVVYPSTGATISYKEWKDASSTVSFLIQPLTSIYFDNNVKFEIGESGNLTQVHLLRTVAWLLIFLAVINYVNLVTARSSVRSKEMGLKKTFGAGRPALIAQIISESTAFSLLAMIIACSFIQLILWTYHRTTGADLTGPIPFFSANFFYLFLFTVAVGILAGIYPAFYLTDRRNRLTIRSSGAGKDRPAIRNILVTFQFAIATGLVFVSFTVFSQLNFMKTKDKGFNSDGLVVIDNVGDLKDHAEAFRQLVQQQAAVVSASFCGRTPAGNSIIMGTYLNPATNKNMSIQQFPGDDQYIATLGMRLVGGRNFEKNLISDTNSLILNESAVAALGLFHPIGTLINGSQRVIGVVKDFNYATLREKIAPAVITFQRNDNTGADLIIRLRSGNTAHFIDWLRATAKTFLGDTQLHISFMDDQFAHLAEKERLLGNAIAFFTILAIILAILGLIGLTIFTIERRMKEIAIRKVLGADNRTILGLVSGRFIRLAAIASAIAIPASWWFIHRWLEHYAYRVSIGVGTLLLTVSLILGIALTIIGGLTIRALAADPINALRRE
ncbi:MAG TPA: ABC transporter permease [Puia sp.]|jgi:putative ABC transport system permease protein|nr:ABC transporter permease [Puia sp.]